MLLCQACFAEIALEGELTQAGMRHALSGAGLGARPFTVGGMLSRFPPRVRRYLVTGSLPPAFRHVSRLSFSSLMTYSLRGAQQPQNSSRFQNGPVSSQRALHLQHRIISFSPCLCFSVRDAGVQGGRDEELDPYGGNQASQGERRGAPQR